MVLTCVNQYFLNSQIIIEKADNSTTMEYNFKDIEAKWQSYWKKNSTYKVSEDPNREKFYVLDMFPYPSGAGLHVGHPLGYIASDIYSRYKKLQGFNVLHPMGYDSFGLPAEQYAIQTGQHPAITTEKNVKRYREQLDQLGFSYDWDREVRTSEPNYYKWTQWIFKQLFNSWYNKANDKAESIEELIKIFDQEGNINVDAATEYDIKFDNSQWSELSEQDRQIVLLNYRLAYLSDTWVNWCEGLGTVLANDEIKDGVSERGGFPVVQKQMKQWSLRITAYAERLLNGLETIDWTDALKEQQRNWIGRSEGASIKFQIDGHDEKIEVFTTRPDTLFGVTFMVLAPEHVLVSKITSNGYKQEVKDYVEAAAAKSERDRMSDVKNISGQFIGAHVIHPFTNEKIPIWIGDYVLAGYGTGAVMAVPCGDQRDWDFAKNFDLPIVPVFEDIDISESANPTKDARMINSDFLDGHVGHEAIKECIKKIEESGIGKGKINYRLRDAIFSRQRYWGEPFPIYYKDEIPYVADADVVELPPVDKYLPTEEGEPPLARARKEDWKVFEGDRMEYNTMPGWAGSSWYFLRYMDALNDKELVSKEKIDYWKNVDLYIGGSEHATGHLLYSRFWTKFLHDIGVVPFEEPFKKLINQGMILGRSNFVYRVKGQNEFVSGGLRANYEVTPLHVDINIVDNDELDIEAFKKWRPEFAEAKFEVLEDGKYYCGFEVEKMSKSKYNVQTPDDLIEKFGADTLRCYEMFLGPLEQAKPWDTKGINGVHNFFRKLWRLFHDGEKLSLSEETPTKEELKVLHKTIKKVGEELNRYSFNTVVSTFMIAVNELTDLKSNNKTILSDLVILISPYAPHISEELWNKLGNSESVTKSSFPEFNEAYLVEDAFSYPVSFNGKMRFKIELPADMSKDDIEKTVLGAEQSQKWLDGKPPKKVIVVPKRIVNIVV